MAEDLRVLGDTQPLGGPPELQPTPDATPTGQHRTERLQRLLATARLLNRKLDRLGAPAEHLATRSAPANDVCASATVASLGTYTGNTAGATNDGSATCGSSASSPDVWYVYTATADQTVTFDTYDSSYDTVLSLHSACPPAGTELACSDDANGTAQSAATLAMTNGQQVWVRVSGFGDAAGSYTLHVAETGGLSGTVTRQDTAAAVQGATVTIYRNYSIYVTQTQTGSEGTYEVDGLPLDTYYAQATANDFIPELYDGVLCPSYSSCTPGFDGTAITVGSAITGGIDFALPPGGSISGVLTDAGTGDPLQGYVYLYAGNGGSYLTSTSTDADGSYQVTGLPAGEYYLEAQASNYQAEVYDNVPCYSCDVTTGTLIPVTVGAAVTGIDFALTHLGAIDGTVTDESTVAPISELELELFDAQGNYVQDAYTSSDGTYQFQAVPAGTFYVRTNSSSSYRNELYDDISCENGCTVTSGTPISVSLASTASGIDFALIPYGRISGTLTESGTGAPLGDEDIRFYDSGGSPDGYVYTAVDGTYLSPGLRAGTHFAVASSSGHQTEVYDDLPCPGACDPTSGTPISVTNATTTSGVDFALTPYGKISGTVTDAGTGLPLGYFYVEFYGSDGHYKTDTYVYGQGNYLSPGLTPGTYYAVTDCDLGYQNEVYDDVPCVGSCNPLAGRPISVTNSTTTSGVDFALTPLGRIQGMVTAADTGDPLYAEVYAFDGSGQQVAYNYTTSGSFDFKSLPSGSYYLKAVYLDSPDEYEDEVYPTVPCEPSCTLSQGTPVSVSPGTTAVGLDLALSRCSFDSYDDLVGLEIVGDYTAEACRRVSATSTTVHSGADVTFRAGREVVLGSGFVVQSGASFEAVVDPSIVQP